jgi:hypothetical protein
LAIFIHTNDANAFVNLEALNHELFCSYTGTNSLEGLTQENAITAYPIPFQESITIEYNLDPSEPITVNVINSVGEIIYKRTLSENEIGANGIELNGLQFLTGVYVLILTTEKMS